MTNEEDFADVTRLQIVTELGRYEHWADCWEFSLQDDGRTLKVWGRGEGDKPRAERNKKVLEDIEASQADQRARMLASQQKRAES